MSNRASSSSSSSGASNAPDESVVASVSYAEWQGPGGFAYSVRAVTRRTGVPGDPDDATSGLVEMVGCKAIVCLESDANCVVGEYYEPGCCVGPDCPNSTTKCGEHCPPPPESCYLTHPDNHTCLRPECYTCHKVNGQDAYALQNVAFAIDCLQVGTSIRSDNQQEYKWAIFCGPMISGPVPEENRDLGEYQCGALRLGANFSDDDQGIQAALFPCQYLALAECGCGRTCTRSGCPHPRDRAIPPTTPVP